MMSARPLRSLDPNDPNVAMLGVVAGRLGPELCQTLVFVGGAAAGLLVSDPAQPALRPTEDVDLIAQVLALRDYRVLEGRLLDRGFRQDTRPGAPICRWVVDGVTVDVMPTLPEVLGFSNRWYPLAAQTAAAVGRPARRRAHLGDQRAGLRRDQVRGFPRARQWRLLVQP